MGSSRSNSYLYNGDTIRTANEALATIHFLGNEGASNVVEVDSNTMVQIFAKNEESELNLNLLGFGKNGKQ